MSRGRMIPVPVVLAFCLSAIFPLKAEAKVTHEIVKCSEGAIKQLPNGAYGCTTTLKVRQPGHGGGGGNPNDWGMCGVLNLSGKFGPASVAQIIVDASGYYEVELEGNSPSTIPSMDATCVLFSDFKGGPPASEATASGPPPLGFDYKDGGYPGKSQTIKGSARNACVWAGLSGNLITIDQAAGGAFGEAAAEFDVSESFLVSMDAKSYAFCNGYATLSWKGWTFVFPKPNFAAPLGVMSLGLDDAHDWCYMQGIEAHLLSQVGDNDAYISGSKPISGGLDLSSGSYSYNAIPHGGTWISYNCLPLKQ